MDMLSSLSHFCTQIQRSLFPFLEEEICLTEQHKKLVKVLELAKVGRFLPYITRTTGRPEHNRSSMAKAFVAKVVFNMQTTKSLIDRLRSDASLRLICGYRAINEIPSESSFSRAFAEFTKLKLPERLHEALIKETFADGMLVWHIARDATAIDAREKPKKSKEKAEKPKRKIGRTKKGASPEPKPLRQIQLQQNMNPEERLASLPTNCNQGTKRNAKGCKNSWTGYKLHIDTADFDIPISCVLTSASMHDSLASLPLASLSSSRVNYLYELMDAAYDSPEIHEEARKNNVVAIIDKNPRTKSGAEAKKLEEKARNIINIIPPEVERYKQRSSAERTNSYIKDWAGGKNIFVKGHAKVMTHLMFGVLCYSALQIFKLAT